MIPFIIIRKVLLSLVPLILFYLLRKIGNKRQPKRKSHLSEFDKSQIVEGEIVDESSRNR
jgi:hypothetical protein